MPRFNTIVAAENFFEYGFGARFELRVFRPFLNCFPNCALTMPLRWNRCAEPNDEHGLL
jgi:hypothetical protein